jgi:pimeloyl-ACP methyl ester carboxylesterase
MTRLFFIHGMWDTPRIWQNYADFFSRLGYRVHTPPLVQHFSNNQKQHVAQLSLDDYVNQLEEDFHGANNPANQIVIVGHGMGALLAQLLAQRVECQALVLLAPLAPAGLQHLQLNTIGTLSKLLMTPLFWKSGIKLDPKATKHWFAHKLNADQQSRFSAQRCYESGKAIYEIAFWYLDTKKRAHVDPKKITCPVLTLTGSDDRLVRPKLAKHISQYYRHEHFFHELFGMGHLLNLEDGWDHVARKIHVWICWQLATSEPLVNGALALKNTQTYANLSQAGTYTATS